MPMPLGHKASAETKLKMSLARKGKPKTEEWKRKIGDANRGRVFPAESFQARSDAQKNRPPITEETRRKLSEANLRRPKIFGRIPSAETRAKMSAASKGRPHPPFSEETLKKMSESHLGKTQSPESIRKRSEKMKGRILTKEHREKISLSLIGDKHPNWMGGRHGDYGPEFDRNLKKKIRTRDVFLCVVCGELESNKKHSCHHIDYDKKNNAEYNLVTLCSPCHQKTNYNREYWTWYFTSLATTLAA